MAPLKPRRGAGDYAFQPSINRISGLPIGLPTPNQLLPKKRSIFLLI